MGEAQLLRLSTLYRNAEQVDRSLTFVHVHFGKQQEPPVWGPGSCLT